MTMIRATQGLLASLILCGCASTQLNYNALDLSESLDALTTKQIGYNLARTLYDEYAVPSQAAISAGTVQTTNSVSPTFTTPFNTSSVITNMVANTTTATGTMKAVTNTDAITHPNSGLSLALTDNWQQGWTLNPASDPDQLRRLRALYRYATGKIEKPSDATIDDAFLCEYPIQALAGAIAAGVTDPTTSLRRDDSRGARVVAQQPAMSLPASAQADEPPAAMPEPLYQAPAGADNGDAPAKDVPLPPTVPLQCPSQRKGSPPIVREIAVDPAFVREPSCVVCRDARVSLFVNRALEYGFVDDTDDVGKVQIGSYRGKNAYVCKSKKEQCGNDGLRALHEFALFVFEANGQSSSPNSANKSPSVKALGAPLLIGPIR